MSPSERWRMSAGILVLLPAAAWLVVVQHTEPLPPDRKLQALSALVVETPQKPLLLLALLAGLVLALICVWTIAQVSQDEFAGEIRTTPSPGPSAGSAGPSASSA